MADGQSDLRAIFCKALERDTPQEQADYLDQACQGQPELRARAQALLRANDEASGFLAEPSLERVATANEPLHERPGAVIGAYKLLEQIGEGGFGIVFMAEQQAPIRRKVALKILKPGMDSRQIIARFEAERQALALMDDPNIAKVLEAGQTSSGRPYFVMELVKGLPITEYCDQAQLNPKERLELFVYVCQAVQHAHQKGIIHRDLKPSNVLVTLHDGTPVAKVIDFGIAKALGQQLTDKTLFTGFAQMIGTPLYMAPEQAGLSNIDVDTRSDIYSLGVLLYELLTGTTPFDKERLSQAGYDEMRRIIREEEPPRPSTRVSTLVQAATSVAVRRKSDPKRLSQLFKGELDWIVMKALEKDRNRRYDTASAFAADVRHYLHDEPVSACPPSPVYRLRKFVRRNQRALATAALAAVLLLVAVGAVAGSLAWMAADQAARQHETEQGVLEASAQAETYLAEGDKQMDNPLRWQISVALADEAARRAEGLLATGVATAELAERVRRVREAVDAARRDSDLGAELERILLEKAAVKRDHYDLAGAVPRYASVLRACGVDVAAPAAAAARVRESRLREQLLAALGDWWRVTSDPAEKQRVYVVLQAAEPAGDAFRQQWREAMLRGDRDALPKLAGTPAVEALPVAAVLILANDLMFVKQWAAAERLLRPWQERYPGNFWLNHQLGAVLRMQKPPRTEEAVRYLTAALALRSDSPGVYLCLGVAQYDHKDMDGAIHSYQAALKIDPNYAAAHINVGVVLRDRKDVEGAIRAFETALRIDPNYAEAHFNLGAALADKEDLEGAIREYQAALKIDPAMWEAHNNLGNILRDTKDLEGAIREFQAMLKIVPNHTMAHTNLGNVLLAKKDVKGAIRALKAALRIDPDCAAAHHNLGIVLDDQNDREGAIREYQAALKINPSMSAAYNALGNALREQNDLEGAIRALNAALKIDPHFAEAHHNLGITLYGKNDLAGAIRELHLALKIKPNYAQAHYSLGYVLIGAKDPDGAIREYRAALKINPNYAEAHCNLGGALLQKGLFAEALAELRRGRQLGTQDPHWPFRASSAQQVRQAEQLAALAGRLPRLLKGEEQPANARERLTLASMCQEHKQLFAAAARWYAEAFVEQPQLVGNGNRYNAACAAALAGCGQGQDAANLGEKERTRLRRQALDWLRADLDAWRGQLQKGSAPTAQQMRLWRQDPDFNGVRGPKALAQLPESERGGWQRLWQDVDALLQEAAAPAKPPAPMKKALGP